MYLCLCADKCEDDIRKLIDDGITDIDEIMEATEVGTGCGTCQMWVKKMIQEELISS